MAIEFTTPEAVPGNIEKLAAMKLPVVVGTTGWSRHMDQVRASVEKNGSALVWSPNFSVGVNVFLRVVREAARLLANEKEYGAWAWEIHHDTKKDAPSGTTDQAGGRDEVSGVRSQHRREFEPRGAAPGDA